MNTLCTTTEYSVFYKKVETPFNFSTFAKHFKNAQRMQEIIVKVETKVINKYPTNNFKNIYTFKIFA